MWWIQTRKLLLSSTCLWVWQVYFRFSLQNLKVKGYVVTVLIKQFNVIFKSLGLRTSSSWEDNQFQLIAHWYSVIGLLGKWFIIYLRFSTFFNYIVPYIMFYRFPVDKKVVLYFSLEMFCMYFMWNPRSKRQVIVTFGVVM